MTSLIRGSLGSPFYYATQPLERTGMRFHIWVVVALTSFCATVSTADEQPKPRSSVIELIGVATLPGNAKDKSGLNDALDADCTNDMLGGFSAIDYNEKANTYYFLSDRGPKDGAVDWSCRFQKFRISINVDAKPRVQTQHLGTTLLTKPDNVPFTGMASAFPVAGESQPQTAERLDPEGLRVLSDGNILISDEYGPRLIEFAGNGKMQREVPVPQKLLIKNPGLTKQTENPINFTGRQTNRGMEGLAVSPDQRSVFGLMQSPLLQDSFRQEITDKPSGLNCRLIHFALGNTREYLYPLEDASNKLNEIVATGPDAFVVIERDGEAGEAAKFKKLMLISTRNASDISYIEKLSPTSIDDGIQPVRKTVLIDLLDPKWKLAGADMPEKIEGLTFGPKLPDGRMTLLVSSDNDFESSKPSYIYVFAVPGQTLLQNNLITQK